MATRLSIIVPTVSRSVEFKRFLDSLLVQKHLESVELIVVDQNDDDRVSQYLLAPKELSLTHLKEKKISLSYAKNRGLDKASGEFCCFLDDDCWLDGAFLEKVFQSLSQLKNDRGLLLKAVTPRGDFLVPCELMPEFRLEKQNIFDSFFAPQIAQIYPTATTKKLNGFNERLGVGTEFGSAEDTDMLVRLVKTGVVFKYQEEAVLFHPEVDYASMTPEKSYQYGLGFGAFCKIHGWTFYWLYKMIRSLAGVVINLVTNLSTARSYLNTLMGRLMGFLNYERKNRG